jgi:DivIVA domain-containing protein
VEGRSSERRHFPPVREGYDRVAVDAYLRDLAAEVEALTQASGALHERARTLGSELRTLTASLRASVAEPPAATEPAQASSGEGAAVVFSGASSGEGAVVPSEASPRERAMAASSEQPPPSAPAGARGEENLDGARLVALNMALNGEPREQTDRHLAERFQLADRAKLLDEVYAAIDR